MASRATVAEAMGPAPAYHYPPPGELRLYDSRYMFAQGENVRFLARDWVQLDPSCSLLPQGLLVWLGRY